MIKLLRTFGVVRSWEMGLLVGLALCAGCQSPPDEPPVSAAPPPDMGVMTTSPIGGESPTNTPAGSEIMQVGDRVTLIFGGVPGAPGPHQEQIGTDGCISPPLLYPMRIMAAGRSRAELREELEKLYVPAYFKNVTITVRSEERYFWVFGEVMHAGQHAYLSEMTILKAIATAGGFTPYANRGSVLVTRADGRKLTVNCSRALKDARKDIPIYPGDQIHVRKRII